MREKQTRIADVERIRAALIAAEESGVSTLDKNDIRAAVQAELKRDSRL